jgi:hypothetical protein
MSEGQNRNQATVSSFVWIRWLGILADLRYGAYAPEGCRPCLAGLNSGVPALMARRVRKICHKRRILKQMRTAAAKRRRFLRSRNYLTLPKDSPFFDDHGCAATELVDHKPDFMIDKMLCRSAIAQRRRR